MVGWLKQQGVNVKGVIAPDMIGYWPAGDGDQFDILGDPASAFLVDMMAEAATRQGVAHEKWVQHTFCYGDDHTNFQEAGFPAITPMDCVEAHNVAGSTEDTPHYHMPTRSRRCTWASRPRSSIVSAPSQRPSPHEARPTGCVPS